MLIHIVVSPLYGQQEDTQISIKDNSYSHFNKISKQDLTSNYFYIPDTSLVIRPKNSYTTITVINKHGVNRVAPAGYSTIYPYRRNGELYGTYKLDSNLVCIPFYGGIDEESTIFTFWFVKKDSLEFKHLWQNIFHTKYANSFVDTCVHFNSTKVFIGNTIGGEGGSSWKEIWIAKLVTSNHIGICHSYMKGWNTDGEIRYSLIYDLNNNIINIQAKEVYLELNNANAWDTVRSKTVINKDIDLNTVINEECR
jgi:hypothetical protein